MKNTHNKSNRNKILTWPFLKNSVFLNSLVGSIKIQERKGKERKKATSTFILKNSFTQKINVTQNSFSLTLECVRKSGKEFLHFLSLSSPFLFYGHKIFIITKSILACFLAELKGMVFTTFGTSYFTILWLYSVQEYFLYDRHVK